MLSQKYVFYTVPVHTRQADPSCKAQVQSTVPGLTLQSASFDENKVVAMGWV